jgi:replicative DNA helicase
MAQNAIIELQVINYILKHKSLDLLTKANIRPEQFSDTYKGFITFIVNHERQYHVVPDVETIVATFGDDFYSLEVTESPDYLADKLREFVVYTQFSRDAKAFQKNLEEGSMENALPKLVHSAQEALKVFANVKGMTDITQDTSRVDEYRRKLSSDEPNVSFGIQTLDEEFGGLLPDDLVLVFARLAHGKSFMMTYFAHALHKQGLKILYYSGEMSADQVGYRYDSVEAHYSDKALLFGTPYLGLGKTTESYATYVASLKGLPAFNIVTPRDLGGRIINMNDINRMAEDLKPDVIFIDQLSLFEDLRYGNIMADLRIFSETNQIPVFIAAQANRESATKNEDGEFNIPEINHIAESDAVGHHSTRAIAFCTNKTEDPHKSIMKMAIKKNRHGGPADFKLEVDFEHGIFTELRQKPLRSDTPAGTGAF